MVNQDSHVVSVVLPLPLRDCWPYFREPDLIREWHGWEYDGLTDEITEIFIDNVKISEDHRTLSFGTHLFNFFEDQGATRVDVHRAPLEEGNPWADYVPDIDEGWTSFVQQLRFKLERHRNDARRTLFYSGTPKDPTVAPIQSLGLGHPDLPAVGARYSATVGPGDALTGTVWFISENQVGVTVDDWGDGLLIVENGPEGGPPYTKGEAILTTYGLADEQRAALTDRWSSWWREHY